MATVRSALKPVSKNRRATLPVLLLLLVFLAGTSYLFFVRDASGAGEGAEESLADTLDREDPDDTGGAWRHHDWASGPGEVEGAPGGGPTAEGLIPPAEADDEAWDPQMAAMRRSYRVVGDAGGAALPFDPTERSARVIASEGALPVSEDARCDVRVLPVQTVSFNCLVRVVCDGQVLYPNPEQTAGYAPCEVEDGQPVSALDEGHTAADGDPRIRVDLRAGTVTVGDGGDGVDAYRATLQIGRR